MSELYQKLRLNKYTKRNIALYEWTPYISLHNIAHAVIVLARSLWRTTCALILFNAVLGVYVRASWC